MRTHSRVEVKHFLARAAVHTHVSRAHSRRATTRACARHARNRDVAHVRRWRVVNVVEDGVYDAFVVWAERRDDDAIALDITITSGARAGDVVTVVTRAFARVDVLALVGLPCTLVVENGRPRVELAT